MTTQAQRDADIRRSAASNRGSNMNMMVWAITAVVLLAIVAYGAMTYWSQPSGTIANPSATTSSYQQAPDQTPVNSSMQDQGNAMPATPNTGTVTPNPANSNPNAGTNQQ